MKADGQSDGRVVPLTPANKGGTEPLAESAEGRLPAKRNTGQAASARTPSRKKRESRGLHGVREAARKSRDLKFTALLHHSDKDLLQWSFYQHRRNAAVGIDEITWREYEEDLEERIDDLHGRIHRGAYRAKPSRRAWIPKPDGRQRPLGIAALADPLGQHAVRTVIQCI